MANKDLDHLIYDGTGQPSFEEPQVEGSVRPTEPHVDCWGVWRCRPGTASSIDKSGRFTVTVDQQAGDCLSAGNEVDPKTGQPYPVKWLPCQQCRTLNKVHTRIVSYFCNECAEQHDEDHPSQHAGSSECEGIYLRNE